MELLRPLQGRWRHCRNEALAFLLFPAWHIMNQMKAFHSPKRWIRKIGEDPVWMGIFRPCNRVVSLFCELPSIRTKMNFTTSRDNKRREWLHLWSIVYQRLQHALLVGVIDREPVLGSGLHLMLCPWAGCFTLVASANTAALWTSEEVWTFLRYKSLLTSGWNNTWNEEWKKTPHPL